MFLRLSTVGLFFRDVNWLESRANYFCCIKLEKRLAFLTDLLLLCLTRDFYPKFGVFSLKLIFIYFSH